MYAFSTGCIGDCNALEENPLFRIISERKPRLEISESSSAYLERYDESETMQRLLEEQSVIVSNWLLDTLDSVNNIDEQKLLEQKVKNAKVIKLIHEWLADESDYDEQVWPNVKEHIEKYRLSSRRRFHE